ncbi:glycosyltransferase [Terrisporobacter glycolicus]|nr:glycosyltransferase [Terrisporobacter glycolicus]
MKKRILFVIPSLNIGGGEKSLVNLLNQFDYEKYDVDLFLFSYGGIFEQFLPKEVNIIPLPEKYIDFNLYFGQSLLNMIKKRNLSQIYNKSMFTLINNVTKDKFNADQYNWKYLRSSFEKLDKKYDVAIGYLEKSSIYFCIDKVNANKRIGFIHTHYEKSGMNENIDKKYFKKLDNIVTITEECLDVLKRRFPECKDKMSVIYNIVSPSTINNMILNSDENIIKKKDKQITIVSVGRLDKAKGYELAIDTCKELVNKNFNIKWYVIGEGEERESLTKLINENSLQKNFILLGLKSNPYPYMQDADIFVQTSRYEGKSIALDEAKILKKPIVVTNYETAREQIDNEINGLIVDMNSNDICNGIERIIKDSKLRDRLCNNLSKIDFGTEKEIEKLYRMF